MYRQPIVRFLGLTFSGTRPYLFIFCTKSLYLLHKSLYLFSQSLLTFLLSYLLTYFLAFFLIYSITLTLIVFVNAFVLLSSPLR